MTDTEPTFKVETEPLREGDRKQITDDWVDVGCPECGAVAGFPVPKGVAKRAVDDLNNDGFECAACGFGGGCDLVAL